jgi:hypothetical protein
MTFEDGCVEYSGKLQPNGYGKFYDKISKRVVWAHRYAYEKINGPIPKGLEICHKCNNRSCINPNHLFIGTRSDNMLDASKKGRIQTPRLIKTHCKRGHIFDDANTSYQVNGARECKTCHALRQRKYTERKRNEQTI